MVYSQGWEDGDRMVALPIALTAPSLSMETVVSGPSTYIHTYLMYQNKTKMEEYNFEDKSEQEILLSFTANKGHRTQQYMKITNLLALEEQK